MDMYSILNNMPVVNCGELNKHDVTDWKTS